MLSDFFFQKYEYKYYWRLPKGASTYKVISKFSLSCTLELIVHKYNVIYYYVALLVFSWYFMCNIYALVNDFPKVVLLSHLC